MNIAQMNVDYIDHMGSDLSVVNSARVSFDKTSEWEFEPSGKIDAYKQRLSERDEKLIKYLATHDHWSPFAHTSVQLRIKAPIFVARQLVKHQIGGVWNEISRRYVDSEPEFWFPLEWRSRPDKSMKQGSGGPVTDQLQEDMYIEARELCRHAISVYNEMIENKIAPEQARMILPQNMMTEWYWTGSVLFFARVCNQRLDSHAQKESSEIAEMISNHCKKLYPVSWKYLLKV